jgi:hypothetical protein
MEVAVATGAVFSTHTGYTGLRHTTTDWSDTVTPKLPVLVNGSAAVRLSSGKLGTLIAGYSRGTAMVFAKTITPDIILSTAAYRSS